MEVSPQEAIERIQRASSQDELVAVFSVLHREFSEVSIEQQSEFAYKLLEFAGNTNRYLKAQGLRWLGRVRLRTSDFQSALHYLYQAHDLFYQTAFFPNVLACLMEIGVTYQDLGEYEEALRVFENALELSKQHKRDGGRVASLINLSDTQYLLGHWQQAAQYARLAIELSLELKRTRFEGDARRALALAILEMAVSDEERHLALSELEIALVHLKRADDQMTLASTYAAQSRAWRDLGELKKSQQAAEQALFHAQNYGGLELQGNCELQLGRTQAAFGNLETALEHFYKAKAFYEVNTAKKFLSEVHFDFYKIYKAKGEFAVALEHFEKFYHFESLVRTENALRHSQAIAFKIERENIHRQVVALENLNAQLDQQARQDALTGVANRRSLEEKLLEAFAQAQTQHTPLTLVMLDIDNFKQINDRFLHVVGDQVLQKLARILEQCCRSSDLVARWGGEEFALVLPLVGGVAAWQFCERIRETIAHTDFGEIHGELAVTISIGWCDDTSLTDPQQMLSVADLALYAAKNAGRNCTRPTPNLVP
jgi:diguanylate cyclase (GGDEF)-like protein